MTNPFGIRSLRRGFQVGNPTLQLDTVQGKGPAVISHAHADHAAENKRMRIHATAATADLLRVRGHVGEIVVMELDEWLEFDDWRMKLLPAGHILGSAQVLVERGDGLRLLYTGDMKTRAGRTTELARFEPADDLIIESTFGLPIFRFPSEPEVAASMVAFARDCFDQGLVPVFTGYSLGKGQEIMSILAEAGIPMLIHGAMWGITKIYEKHGIVFGDYDRFSAGRRSEQRAWVIPPHARPQMTARVPKARVCYVSGWALIESRRDMNRASLLAPISDHADYYDLLDVIREVAPSRVWTVHGPYADLFALDVARTFGIDACALDTYVIDEEMIGEAEA